MKKKKKFFHSMKNKTSKRKDVIDKVDTVSYEKVVKLEIFHHQTLVLLGVNGAGKRQIKNALIMSHEEKIAYPIMTTSRKPKINEENGKDFFFVTLVIILILL